MGPVIGTLNGTRDSFPRVTRKDRLINLINRLKEQGTRNSLCLFGAVDTSKKLIFRILPRRVSIKYLFSLSPEMGACNA